jgi:uncharacterized protein (TIGR00369 family)
MSESTRSTVGAVAAPPTVSARERTVTWGDPLVTAAAAREMTGLEFLTAVRDGRLPKPPMAALMGFTLTRVELGRVTFTAEVGEHLYNPIGSVHGGVFCTLLDSAMGCAVHSTLPLGSGYTTVDLNVTLVKGLTVETPTVTAVGEVISVGRRVATASGRLLAPDGTLHAHATTTCLVLTPGAGPDGGATTRPA